MMNINMYFSATQITTLATFTKAIEQAQKIKVPPLELDCFKTTIDPAIYTHVF